MLPLLKLQMNRTKFAKKNNSGNIFQRKDIERILDFAWDMFHKELQLRTPSFLQVFSISCM